MVSPPSPPVPQVSTARPGSLINTGRERARIARAAAAISMPVSPPGRASPEPARGSDSALISTSHWVSSKVIQQ